MEWRRGLRRSCRARRFSQATRTSRVPGPISPAEEADIRRSGRPSSGCCRPPSGSFQSLNDHSVGYFSPRSGTARCHVAKAMSVSRCLLATLKVALRPQPIVFRRAALASACFPVRISQTSNFLRPDVDVTVSHGRNPGRDYLCRGTARLCLRNSSSRWRRHFAIRPFVAELKFGRRPRASLRSYSLRFPRFPGPFAEPPCAEPHGSAPTMRFLLPGALLPARRERPTGDQMRQDSKLPPKGGHRPDAKTQSGSDELPPGPFLPARASSRHPAESVGRSPLEYRSDRAVSFSALRLQSRLSAAPTSSHERFLGVSHDPRYERLPARRRLLVLVPNLMC